MAHKQQKDYCNTVKEKHKDHFHNKRVLEVGSLNVNGSFRELFTDCDYTGIDIVAGKDVDIVCKGHEFESAQKFGVVCSGECFEHDEYWPKTLDKMYDLLEKGGLFFFTCASDGRAEHGTKRTGGSIWGTNPNYYQNINEAMVRTVWNPEEMFDDFEFIYNPESKDLYFKGIKK